MPFRTIDGSKLSSWSDIYGGKYHTLESTYLESGAWIKGYTDNPYTWATPEIVPVKPKDTHPKMRKIKNKLACKIAKYAKYPQQHPLGTHHISLLPNGNFMYYINGVAKGEYGISAFGDTDWVLVDSLS